MRACVCVCVCVYVCVYVCVCTCAHAFTQTGGRRLVKTSEGISHDVFFGLGVSQLHNIDNTGLINMVDPCQDLHTENNYIYTCTHTLLSLKLFLLQHLRKHSEQNFTEILVAAGQQNSNSERSQCFYLPLCHSHL